MDGQRSTRRTTSAPANGKSAAKPKSGAAKPKSGAAKPKGKAAAPAATASSATKPVPKRAPAAKLVAKTDTPAKVARRAELCGALPGGIDAYYFSERCIAKKQLDQAMTRNRRAAAFVGKAMQEMPVLEKLMRDADPSPADLQVAFNDPMAVEAAVRFMTDPANMESHPDPSARYAAAVAKLSRAHPNVGAKPHAFKKMVMRQTYNTFYASAQNVQRFKGRPTTRKAA